MSDNDGDLLATLKSAAPARPILSSALCDRDLTTAAARWAASGLTVRAVRGRKAMTVPDLFDEFAAALQFPYYFGENWAAFDECLADLDWLPCADGLAIVVYDSDQLLRDATDADRATFFKVVTRAATVLGQPINDGEEWDRPGIAFHLVLQVDDGDHAP